MSSKELRAYFIPHTLHFVQPSGTSRGILKERRTWYLVIYQKNHPERRGFGECAPLKGLSIDDRTDFEKILNKVCKEINNYPYWLREGLQEFPSIKFGLETAMLDFCNSGERILYPSAFTQGKDSILINGLIWMGDFKMMKKQVEEKIANGFCCIKLKIGAIDFEKEMSLLKFIREKYSSKDIEIRVDANGAFSSQKVLRKLETLSKFQIHSIEQPIKHGQWKKMAELCKETPIPIALDEELIGIKSPAQKKELLAAIKPQYIILKPTLIGGFSESLEWIKLAEEKNIGWWITSALESNIGLNAISQWTYTLGNPMPQGLGTAQLFTNNFESPLYLKSEKLFFNPELAPFPFPLKEGRKKKTAEGTKLVSFIKEWRGHSTHITSHTSGTTGTPKKVLIEKDTMLQSALMTIRYLRIQPNDTALLSLSSKYIAGKMMVVRAFAGMLHLLPIEPSSNPLKSIPANEKIDFAAFVPLQVQEILDNAKTAKRFQEIKNVLIGGAPVSRELRTQISKLKNNVYETYGMTETVSHIALKRLSARSSNWFETLDGITISKDTRGCLVINAPFISKNAIVTNDFIQLKDNKHFKWLGRADNVINSGGIKLLPEVIEEKIKPALKQRFFLLGKKDASLGEKLTLVIEGTAFSETVLLKLKKKLSQLLSKYEMPKEIFFVSKFRETENGKIIRSLT